ncbi:MAG: ABC transporter ATP-binding protein/permease [Bryobacterales bacterium]|nr:ABC transporter ATP-binding protein/permease [Bryobacterales bacterium]MEB2359791.1 ABC transporter ATP-binding protein [Bryobacterales bacterium]
MMIVNRLSRFFRAYRTFVPFLKPYWRKLLLACACLLMVSALRLIEPWPLKIIFDYVLWSKPLPAYLGFLSPLFEHGLPRAVTLLCLALLAITLLKSVFSYTNRYLASAAGEGAVNDIRLRVFGHLQSLSLFSLAERRTGDMVVRLTSDVRQLRELLVNDLKNLGEAVLTFTFTLAMMLWIDWRLTLIALTVVPVLLLVSGMCFRQVRSATRRRMSKESEVAAIVQETMSSITVVQAFNQEKQEKTRLKRESGESYRAAMESVRWSRAFSQIAKVLSTLGTVFIVWYGVARALEGKLGPGDVILFAKYAADLYDPINRLSDLLAEFMNSLVAGERVAELLDLDGAVKDTPGAIKAPRFEGEARFEGVTFGYTPGNAVLKDVSFTAKPGESVALVGPSGTGKSTVVKLLMRFYDPWEGVVLIDGQDIRRFQVESLRDRISVVPQDPYLFRRSIRENIAYGNPDASLEEIVAAARAAQAHDFILQLPQGYDTILDESGGNLSGGQRQRIALARALLKDTPFLVLDEPATGLDEATEERFYDALLPLIRNKTTFIVTHRPPTIRRADKVLFIEEGRAAGFKATSSIVSPDVAYLRLSEIEGRPSAAARPGGIAR